MLDDAARRLIDDSDFTWHQQFHLSENVLTPGAANIEWLIDRVGLPRSLEGRTFLDVGTTNGGAAFVAEARGAERVVAVDIADPHRYGFDTLHEAIGSRVEFVRGTIYDLPQVLDEQFDEVFFLGVLYHLRHPLLALDSLRRLTRGNLYVESAVSGSPADGPSARFFRRKELGDDGTNWFAPTVSCLVDWVESSGFVVDRVDHWPADQPERACLAAHPAEGAPEFQQLSYEVPLTVTAPPLQ